ncbi:hypothetical protein [Corynebacterium sp. CCUG 65737]|nr:hypothetical protein [Corynebacterium sp. CCUG 65737]
MEFFAGSSQFADGLGKIWEPIFKFMEPLVKAAEGAEKLLKLLP